MHDTFLLPYEMRLAKSGLCVPGGYSGFSCIANRRHCVRGGVLEKCVP